MLASLGLSSAQIEVLSMLAFRLSEIPGVAAVVLGGSYARGTARSDSDLDVGIYYSEHALPNIDAVRHCAELVSSPDQPPTVTEYYAWGPWVNGGAWIRTPAGKVDLLYRNANQVRRVLDEGHQLAQALFALNAEYYFGDKGALEAIDRFPKQPKQFSARLQHGLATPGTTPSQLEGAVCEMHKLWLEAMSLTEGKYAPRFHLNGTS